MTLPASRTNQGFWTVSAIEAGQIRLKVDQIVNGAGAEEYITAPSLSFLLRHSSNPNNMVVFDLGIRKDYSTGYPPAIARVEKRFPVTIQQDAAESLQIGGVSPSAIAHIILSHLHWDHVGDTRPFTNATFLVGADAKQLLTTGYPADPHSQFASDLLPRDRTKFLYSQEWAAVGPFPHGLDFFGDGSLYIIDSAGHCPGHVNVLARTSNDGAWIYLAGDSGHHWGLLQAGDILAAINGRMHADKEQSAKHLGRIRELLSVERVRVLLAHDEPWYNDNKGGDQYWPGSIPSL